jgi:hypothetical protein
MATRRNFFKYLGLAGGAAAGGAVAAASLVASDAKSKAVKEIETHHLLEHVQRGRQIDR